MPWDVFILYTEESSKLSRSEIKLITEEREGERAREKEGEAKTPVMSACGLRPLRRAHYRFLFHLIIECKKTELAGQGRHHKEARATVDRKQRWASWLPRALGCKGLHLTFFLSGWRPSFWSEFTYTEGRCQAICELWLQEPCCIFFACVVFGVSSVLVVFLMCFKSKADIYNCVFSGENGYVFPGEFCKADFMTLSPPLPSTCKKNKLSKRS